ncbi:amino acid ABC transporter permease [Cohaesibacter celericrescens]|uniref:amino acid ABC transporter permease n=1 Tax=Cohaesibacter celericrescens TaxID=2067669 RepID=UPI00356AD5E6
MFIVGIIGLVPALMPTLPFKRENVLFMLIVFPVMTFILLTGGNLSFENYLVEYTILFAIVLGLAALVSKATHSPMKAILLVLGGIGIAAAVIFGIMSIDFGLVPVETAQWGGFLVTLVIAITGIVASLPLGIALALGRRSKMPVVRLVSIIFIEFWRGVPLITVLFMSSVVLPLFLPEGVNFDKLLRALIGVALFSAAYMAEVVRGGLQAIPKGQYEGADALGLTFWQSTGLIIMPQALKLVIPGIVNTFIGLFKDTTLVLIIGLFDLLGQVQTSFTDPTWSTPTTSHTGYLFAAIVFWVFCFSMSRYSIFMENRLHTGHKR